MDTQAPGSLFPFASHAKGACIISVPSLATPNYIIVGLFHIFFFTRFSFFPGFFFNFFFLFGEVDTAKQGEAIPSFNRENFKILNKPPHHHSTRFLKPLPPLSTAGRNRSNSSNGESDLIKKSRDDGKVWGEIYFLFGSHTTFA